MNVTGEILAATHMTFFKVVSNLKKKCFFAAKLISLCPFLQTLRHPTLTHHFPSVCATVVEPLKSFLNDFSA